MALRKREGGDLEERKNNMHISDETIRNLKVQKLKAEKEFDTLASELMLDDYYEPRNLNTVEDAALEDEKENYFDPGDVQPNISDGITNCVKVDNALSKYYMYDGVSDLFDLYNNQRINDRQVRKRAEELISQIRKYKKDAKTVIELEQEFIDNCDSVIKILDDVKNS